jgi:hypothetical protein
MYPKNAASPERIAVGAIYQISDGAIQTAGASVRVMPQGGAAGAGGGTLACDSTSGIWHYTPTQAETNYTSFMVLVYKASCTSASITVVTTATAVAGTVDVGAISGSTTAADNVEVVFHTDFASNYDATNDRWYADVKAWDGAPASTSGNGYPQVDIYSISNSVTSADNAEIVFSTDFATNYNTDRNAWVTNAQDFVGTTAADPFSGQVVAASVTAKTGYSLAADGLDGVTLPADIITAASINTGAFTADAFAAGALVAATFAASSLNGKGDWNTTTPPTVEQIRTEMDSNSTQLAAIVEDTGTTLPATLSTINGYVDCLPATLDGSTFTSLPEVTTDAASRTASKADVSALATTAALAAVDALIDAIKEVTDKLDTALVQDGAVYDFTAEALAAAPGGGGGDATAANQVTILAYVDELETRLSAVRAAYLDKLNVSGTLAHSDAAATYKADVSGLATAANQTTILSRLGAFTGSGVNTVLGFFKALLSKTADTPSDVGGTFSPAADSTEAISEVLALVGGEAGSGAIAWTIECQVAGTPIEGVEVWVTTDEDGANVIAGTLITDSAGEVDFMLDAGTYYAWRQLGGYNFTNPQSFTVTE